MPRPCKNRKVRGKPSSNYFKPAGIEKSNLEEIELTIEEFESLRLTYTKELSQNDAAEKMHISQPTFSRILTSATKKISKGIVEGKAIKINKE
jgi:predicted DNA-binding protein (UPF0251 family)